MLVLSLISFIVSNSFTLRKDKSILYSRASIINLILTTILAYIAYYINFLSIGIGIYGGLFFINSINKFFHFIICILSSIILIFNSFYPRKLILTSYLWLTKYLSYSIKYNNTLILNKTSEKYKILEYPLIILFIITGALFLTTSNDLISIFISLELQSYGIYLLSSIYKNSESSTAGGLMYFLLGGLSSCLILLGISLIYANLGTTSLDNIYSIYKIAKISLFDVEYTKTLNYLDNIILIMFIGFLFKISAAPFHFWSPDVYDAIPTVVTTFVSIIAKISILILLLELTHNLSNDDNFSFKHGLIVSSILSLFVGSILGLREHRIKRLYAYSTISHIGFILLGLSIHTIESTQAFLFYLLQYSFSNLNAFIILISIGYLYNQTAWSASGLNNQFIMSENYIEKYGNIKNKDTSPIQYIDQLKGFFFFNPVLSLSLSITLFSFAGIPPLIGFFGKMAILSSAISSGAIILCLIAILTSVISASYYLFIIKKIFFEIPDYFISSSDDKINSKKDGYDHNDDRVISEQSNFNSGNEDNNTEIIDKNKFIYFKAKDKLRLAENVVLSNYISISISILTLIILLFMFVPEELFTITSIFSMILFNV